MSWPAANATAFFLSAQLNFVLSSVFTWRDRTAAGPRWTARRWVSYNGTVLLSLAVNSAVFAAVYPSTGALIASAAGVVVGATTNYLICNHLVFRSRPAVVRLPATVDRPAEQAEKAQQAEKAELAEKAEQVAA